MWSLSLAALLTAILAHAQTYTPNLVFNVTVASYSPLLLYATPDTSVYKQTFSNTTDPSAPWVNYFDRPPLDSYVEGQIGLGISHMVSHGANTYNLPDPSMLVNWAGSGIYVFGKSEPNITDTVSLAQAWATDGESPIDITSLDHTDNLIVSESFEGFQSHQSILTNVGGMVDVWNVTFTTGIMDTGDPTKRIYNGTLADLFSAMGTWVPAIKNNALNDFFTWNGNWTTLNTIGGVEGTPVEQYDHALGSNLASIELHIPKNTSFVLIDGLVGPQSGMVSIKLSPQPQITKGLIYQLYNPYVQGGTIYMSPLDPTIEYDLTLSTDVVGNNNSAFSTDEAGIYGMGFLGIGNSTSSIGTPINGSTSGMTNGSANGSTDGSNTAGQQSKGSSNKGAIIGGAVGGGVGGLLLLALLGFCIYHRKTAHRRDVKGPTVFEIDESAVTSPFITTASGETKPAMAYDPHIAEGVTATRHDSPVAFKHHTLAQLNNQQQLNADSSSSGGGPSSSSASALPAKSGLAPAPTQVPVPSPAPAPAPAPPPAPSGPSHVAQHFAQEEDGGAVELIPPSYNPQWANGNKVAGPRGEIPG